MGPWIVTADELGAADNLAVKLWVNDNLKQDGETSDLIFNVPQLVSHMSQFLTLGTGAVISTGTPSGVGMARKPPEYLRPGDQVTLEIEGIGRLSNPVEAACSS
ncbi:MAG: fumarylacetoacetate hydrolase family protein [Acidimicrobiia bacterium]|nr:fumarylacetoacetate hydrolase family protein [Acidimicrobiia bacterium]